MDICEKAIVENVKSSTLQLLQGVKTQSLPEIQSTITQFTRILEQNQKIVVCLTPGTDIYEFFEAQNKFLDEQIAMMRIVEHSFMGLKGSAQSFLKKISDIYPEV